jgi:gliding motility-associated lipoprotein GldB
MRRIFILFFLFIVITACDKKSKAEKEVEEIPIDLKVERFEKAFFDSKPEDLAKVKSRYPMFFPPGNDDRVWLEKLQHPQWRELYGEIEKKYGTFATEREQLEDLFRHIKFYFPRTPVPKVITVIGDMDYNSKAIYADSIVVISLELYLGKNHRFYTFPDYLKQNFEQRQMMPDIVSAFAMSKIRPADETLLSQMIYYGKALYLKDLLIPDFSDAEKIGYTPEALAWAKENEPNIWRFFVDEQLLYSNDPKLPGRFIEPAPFSKFYLEIDNESPGRLGQFIGWNIVRAFMENNDVPLADMLKMDARQIFEKSKYKPAKNE